MPLFALWSLATRRFTDGNGWVAASNSPVGTLHRNDTYWNGDARMSRVYQWQPGATPQCNTAQPASCTALTTPGVLSGEPILLFSGDPLRAGMFWTYTSRLVCLAAGTYTFAFDYRYVGCWHRSQYLDAALVRPSSVVGQTACSVTIGSRVTAPANSAPGGGTVTMTVVVPYTSQWQWQYTWTSNDTEVGAGTLPCATCTPIGSTGRTACNLNTNDIGVTKPRCTGYSTAISGAVCPTP